MSFREIFERYLKNEATAEEIALVEDELERAQVLNDYFLDKVDEATSLQLKIPEETIKKETKKIKKKINKKFRRTVLKVLASILGLVLCAILIISPILDACFYSPYAPSEYQNGKGENYTINDTNLFSKNLRALSELLLPGIDGIYAENVKKIGASYYAMQINQYFFDDSSNIFDASLFLDQFSSLSSFNRYPSRGTRYMLSDGSWNHEKIVYYTLSEKYPYDGAHNPDPHAVDFETVPDLPATAQLTGYLTFREPLSMDALMDKMIQYNSTEHNVTFQWIEVVTSDPTLRLGEPRAYSYTNLGFTYQKFRVYSLINADAGPQYFSMGSPWPLYYEDGPILMDFHSGEAMEHHFTSLLNQMIENPEFCNVFTGGTGKFQEALSYVQQNGIKSPCVLITASRDDVLALRDDPDVDRFAIDNVTLSEYSK